MGRTCLVTGSAGFIGSRLSARLLEERWSVCGLDAFTDSYDSGEKRARALMLARHPNYRHVEADLANAGLRELLESVEVVFHLAGRPGVRDSFRHLPKYRHDNVQATAHLLDEARASGSPRRIVYASSSSVYGDAARPFREAAGTRPISPYGETKLEAERTCLAASGWALECVALRYFTVYGPGQRPDMSLRRFIEAGIAGRPIRLYGDGTQSRDFTYVDDAVEATVRAADAPAAGLAVNVASGEPVALHEVLDLLAGLLGRELLIEREPFAAGDARHTSADLSRAAALLGFRPAVDLRTGLSAEIDWLSDQVLTARATA